MAVSESPARIHHESQVEAVLSELRMGPIRKKDWERRNPGCRLAPSIDVLRNSWLLRIDGNGADNDPYRLAGQDTDRVKVTETMREAYYASEHWRRVRRERLELDQYQCVLCKQRDNLQVHHWTYQTLFAERILDVETRCEDCHARLHSLRGIRLAFPVAVPREIAVRLGWRPGDGRLF